MPAAAIVLFILAALFAVTMHECDRRLQRHRAKDAPTSAFRWVPLRWSHSSHYEASGDIYRRNAIRFWWLMVVCFMGAAALTAASA